MNGRDRTGRHLATVRGWHASTVGTILIILSMYFDCFCHSNSLTFTFAFFSANRLISASNFPLLLIIQAWNLSLPYSCSFSFSLSPPVDVYSLSLSFLLFGRVFSLFSLALMCGYLLSYLLLVEVMARKESWCRRESCVCESVRSLVSSLVMIG